MFIPWRNRMQSRQFPKQSFHVKGWVHPDFYVKIYFEITVDQQTRVRDQTFEGIPDSGCPPVPAGQSHPHLVNFWLNFSKSP